MSVPTEPFVFEGFQSPNVTPVPDVLFDYLAPRLSEAELRVLLYIVRRMYGFKKTSDAISITQMVDGIRTRRDDGSIHVLDEGTGMGRKGVCSGISGLLSKGVIEVERRRSPRGDADINVYRLRFQGNAPVAAKAVEQPKRRGVVSAGNHRSVPGEPRVVSEGNGQHDRSQHDRSQQQPAERARTRSLGSTSPRGSVVVEKILDEKTSKSAASEPVISALVSAGITQKAAVALVSKFGVDPVKRQLDALPFRQAREPAAVLVQSITESWEVPKAYTTSMRKEASRKQEELARAKRSEEAKARQQADEDRKVQADAYLSLLSNEERKKLEDEAVARIVADEGAFWKNRRIPPLMLTAFVRELVYERMQSGSDVS
jgi:hypothetical protein